MAASGPSNQEIPEALWISVTSVETHMRRVLSKLNVQPRRVNAAPKLTPWRRGRF